MHRGCRKKVVLFLGLKILSRITTRRIVHLKVDDDRFVSVLVDSIEDSLASHDDDFPPNVELVLEHLSNLVLQAIRILMQAVQIEFDAMKNQIVLPCSVNVVESVLKMGSKCCL